MAIGLQLTESLFIDSEQLVGTNLVEGTFFGAPFPPTPVSNAVQVAIDFTGYIFSSRDTYIETIEGLILTRPSSIDSFGESVVTQFEDIEMILESIFNIV